MNFNISRPFIDMMTNDEMFRCIKQSLDKAFDNSSIFKIRLGSKKKKKLPKGPRSYTRGMTPAQIKLYRRLRVKGVEQLEAQRLALQS